MNNFLPRPGLEPRTYNYYSILTSSGSKSGHEKSRVREKSEKDDCTIEERTKEVGGREEKLGEKRKKNGGGDGSPRASRSLRFSSLPLSLEPPSADDSHLGSGSVCDPYPVWCF
ncbi:hypothetical protein SK128_017413 [Halocaridina rubra]|uniref:Uncharacterized protein n=1 Tax=Halocaridina rubra TaxID=373956 RepID=A0AAN9FUH6_HALRR